MISVFITIFQNFMRDIKISNYKFIYIDPFVSLRVLSAERGTCNSSE